MVEGRAASAQKTDTALRLHPAPNLTEWAGARTATAGRIPRGLGVAGMSGVCLFVCVADASSLWEGGSDLAHRVTPDSCSASISGDRAAPMGAMDQAGLCHHFHLHCAMRCRRATSSGQLHVVAGVLGRRWPQCGFHATLRESVSCSVASKKVLEVW